VASCGHRAVVFGGKYEYVQHDGKHEAHMADAFEFDAEECCWVQVGGVTSSLYRSHTADAFEVHLEEGLRVQVGTILHCFIALFFHRASLT
jgi:hypothetical protein